MSKTVKAWAYETAYGGWVVFNPEWIKKFCHVDGVSKLVRVEIREVRRKK